MHIKLHKLVKSRRIISHLFWELEFVFKCCLICHASKKFLLSWLYPEPQQGSQNFPLKNDLQSSGVCYKNNKYLSQWISVCYLSILQNLMPPYEFSGELCTYESSRVQPVTVNVKIVQFRTNQWSLGSCYKFLHHRKIFAQNLLELFSKSFCQFSFSKKKIQISVNWLCGRL